MQNDPMSVDDVNDTRVLIAPDADEDGSGVGSFISLRHPKSGNTVRYLFVEGTLHELNWFKQFYGSWFLGNHVCEDGGLYTATPVDPVFILLPIFEEARMKKGDDQGKFRQLDEIIFVQDYPGYQQISAIAASCMLVVCEIREIGTSKFYRLDDSKVLNWLYFKVCQIKQTLTTLDKNCAAQDEKEILADAVSILREYMKDAPWLKLLCDRMKLKTPEETRKNEPEFDTALTAINTNGGSSTFSREKKMVESRSNRSGKRGKKEVETSSRNIREMFTRAAKRKC